MAVTRADCVCQLASPAPTGGVIQESDKGPPESFGSSRIRSGNGGIGVGSDGETGVSGCETGSGGSCGTKYTALVTIGRSSIIETADFREGQISKSIPFHGR